MRLTWRQAFLHGRFLIPPLDSGIDIAGLPVLATSIAAPCLHAKKWSV